MWKKVILDNKIETNYSVSDVDGIVRNDTNGHILTHVLDKQGYHTVYLSYDGKHRKCTVHRLVAIAFIPNPENKRTVNHKHGNKDENSAKDLEWATDKENIRHAWDTGLVKARRGVDVPNSAYTEEQIRNACLMIEKGEESNNKIYVTTGVRQNIVSFIRRGLLWKHIACEYTFPEVKPRDAFSKYYEGIDSMISKGKSNGDIVADYPIPIPRRAYFSLIRRRRRKLLCSV